MPSIVDPELARRPVLVLFSGPPGTGKTTLAEHAARWLHAPVFSKDELEATLWRSGIGRPSSRYSWWRMASWPRSEWVLDRAVDGRPLSAARLRLLSAH